MTGLSGVLAFLAVSRVLTGKAMKALGFVGDYSYSIYLLHQPFVVSGFSALLVKLTPLPIWSVCVVTFILGIAVPIAADRLILRRARVLSAVILGNFTKR
jgi:peptidoglycan/LPS O-acetylase OafA/YrhL